MIDILKFMDDLKEIKQMVDDQKPRYTIVDKCNEKIAGYQKEVDEFDFCHMSIPIWIIFSRFCSWFF